jgi:hypothetical protein
MQGHEGAASVIGPLQFEATVVRFHNPAGDGETESGAAAVAQLCACPGCIHPIKPFEEVRLGFRRDTNAGIGYGDQVLGVLLLKAQVDIAAGRGIFDGVVKQVQQHLTQQIVIAVVQHLRHRAQDNYHALPRTQHTGGAGCLGEEFIEIKIARVKRLAAGIGARQQKHIFHNAGQPPCLLVDDFERVLVLAFRPMRSLQGHGGRRVYDRQRRAELMRSVGHELPLSGEGVTQAAQRLLSSFNCIYWHQ